MACQKHIRRCVALTGMGIPTSMHAPDTQSPPEPLRVLIANEAHERLVLLKQDVERLGHEVVASVLEVHNVAAITAKTLPDVALVTLGNSPTHALDLIGEIVREAACPVIALLATDDPQYQREAARRGVFASIVDTSDEELQSAIEITLERFNEYQNLKGAFGRRALIEQAKGILMGRNGITADEAFAKLRERSQASGRKIGEIADALIEAHLLLPRPGGDAEDDLPATLDT
jgi:response regulator NasT